MFERFVKKKVVRLLRVYFSPIQLVLIALTLVSSLTAFSQNQFASGTFNYEGRLLDNSGNPRNDTISIKLEILNNDESCALYAETFSTVDLSGSGDPEKEGFFSLQIGSGDSIDYKPLSSMRDVFMNGVTHSQDTMQGHAGQASHCSSASSANVVIGSSDQRWLRVTINDGSAEVLSPNIAITGVPAALTADHASDSEKLGGQPASQYIVDDGTVTQSDLSDLISGTSATYLKPGDSVSSGADVYAADQMAVGTVTPAAGVELEIQNSDPTLRLEATDGGAGQMAIQFFDTAGTDQAQIMSTEGTAGLTFTTGGSSALVLDASQNAQFQASMTVAGTIQGGVYDNTQETTLALALGTCGAACAGTQWMNSDLSLIRYWDGAAIRSVGSFSGAEAAGHVLTSNGPGNASSFQAIDDTTKLSLDGSDTMAGDLNMGGNEITNLGTPVNTGDAVNKTYADSNLVGETLAAPAVGQNGQSVRWNNGAGNWEYYAPNSGTVTSVTATAPLASSGGATPDISLDFADGLVDNGGSLEVNLSSDLTFATGAVAIATDGVTSTHILDATIANIDVAADADIARTKLADGTANMVLINDGAGAMSESATIDSTELGHLNNVGSNIQTQLDSKQASLGFAPVNITGDAMTGALSITDATDVVQLSVQANSTQTANLFELKDSGGTPIFTVRADGSISAATDIVDKDYVDTAIAGLTDDDTTYTADGNGIELSGTTFNIELDGTTLSKSAAGLKVAESNLDITAIGGYDANDNIDHTSVTLTAGTGLTGTSDISASTTFDVVGGDGIVANDDDIAVDLDTDPGLEFNTGALRVKVGAGLSRDSTGIFHTDTSSVANSDNSNGVILQDITFDTFGHVQTVGTTDLDGRYYTETESDSSFVDAAGDTMTGALSITGSTDTVQLSAQAIAAQAANLFELKSSGGAPVFTVSPDGAINTASGLITRIGSTTAASGTYLDYRPNGAECGDNDVMKWDAENNRWDCGEDQGSVASGSGTVGRLTRVQSTGIFYRLEDSSLMDNGTDVEIDDGTNFTVDTNSFFVDSTANAVGIGTTSPGAKLTVEGSADQVQLSVQANGTQTANLFELKNSAGTPIYTVQADGAISAATDIVDKNYVDTEISGLTDNDTTYSADGLGIEVSTEQFSLELDGNTLSKSATGLKVAEANLDHGSIGGLTDDDHSQYALLAGRSGGQTLVGGTAAGEDLIIESTSHTTKGDVLIQPTTGSVGIGSITGAPTGVLDVLGGRAYLPAPDGAPTGANLENEQFTIYTTNVSDSVHIRARDSGGDIITKRIGGDPYFVSNSTGTVPTATGTDSISVGQLASASGTNSIAIGRNAAATGAVGTAIGFNAAAAQRSIALGDSAASGNNAIAIGINSSAAANNLNIRWGASGVHQVFGDNFGGIGIGATPQSKLTVEGAITLDQLGADPTGTAGYGSLYTKTDGSLYYRDGTGTVTDLLVDADSGGTVTSVSAGTGLTGGPITDSGTISLADTSVAANSYGSASSVATFTVDAQGRLTAAGNTAIGSLDASVLTAGTVAAARMPAFTGDVTSTAGATSLSIGTGVVGTTEIEDGSITITDLNAANVDARYVNSGGDSMTGNLAVAGDISAENLNLVTDGLIVGTDQLVLANGNMGIGVSNPTEAKLHLITNPTINTGSFSGGRFIVDSSTSGTGIPTIRSLSSILDLDSTGTGATTGIGFEATSQKSGSGSIGSLYGGKVLVNNANGTITNAYGIHILGASTGTTTNFTGLEFNAALPAETDVKGISLNVANNDASDFSIYSSGTAKSYFEGNLGIGTDTPTEKLDVAGSARIGGAIDYEFQRPSVNALAVASGVMHGTSTPFNHNDRQLHVVRNNLGRETFRCIQPGIPRQILELFRRDEAGSADMLVEHNHGGCPAGTRIRIDTFNTDLGPYEGVYAKFIYLTTSEGVPEAAWYMLTYN